VADHCTGLGYMSPEIHPLHFTLRQSRHQYVRRFVSALEACSAFQHYTSSVGAQLGSTVRVIVTDRNDCIAREWRSGQGITFPPPKESKPTVDPPPS
jgi:hypothetical protein